MSVVALVRVKPLGGDNTVRPERTRVEEAARQLRASGFKILRLNRFGVSISGSESNYEDVFGVQVHEAEAFSSPVRPRPRGLSDLVVALEVASAPSLF